MTTQLKSSELSSPIHGESLGTDPLQLLQQLIAIPSVNPMGTPVSGSEFLEEGVTDWLVQFFKQLEVPYEVIEVLPGRCNVIARYNAPQSARTILLDAHQDTVPVDGMTVAPFEPFLENGRLYGRGSCDVKGGMAAMLSAFARLVIERPENSSNVIMTCTCDEEYTARGVIDLATTLQSASPSKTLLSPPPDICLVAEPTDLNVVAAHLGVVRWKLRTHGRACHSSRPHEGINAIYRMAELLCLIESYAQQLPELIGTHSLCGSPTLSVGKITGGVSVNIVPAECEIEIDRRLIPGEDPETVVQHLADYLRARTNIDFEMEAPWIIAPALSDFNNQAETDRLLSTIDSVAGRREKQGAWYCTNAATFATTGIPSIVCGPGSIAQAHTCDEWIEISQVYAASEIYYQFCLNDLITVESH